MLRFRPVDVTNDYELAAERIKRDLDTASSAQNTLYRTVPIAKSSLVACWFPLMLVQNDLLMRP